MNKKIYIYSDYLENNRIGRRNYMNTWSVFDAVKKQIVLLDTY